MIDLWLKEDLSIDEIRAALIPALQPGIEIVKIDTIPLSDAPLQTTVIAADYLAQFNDEIEDRIIAEKIVQLLSENTIIRERRNKSYDLRQLIQKCHFTSNPRKGIFMQLSTLPGATGRPEEVLDALGIDLYSVQVVRTRLIFSAS